MPNGVTNHAVNASAMGKLMGAVEVFQGVQGNLAGSGSLSDGCVRQCAAFSQGEDARRQANFAHGYGNEIGGAANETQEAEAVGEGLGMRGNFLSVRLCMPGGTGGLEMRRHAPEVVQGEQDVRRQAKSAQGFAARQFAPGLDFQVAPGAARLAGHLEPVKFGFHASSELAASFPTTACSEETWRRLACSFSASEGSGSVRHRCGANPGATR